MDLYKSMRQLQLFVTLFNLVNQYMLFTSKLICISVSIVSGYATIAHFNDYPIFGIMYCVIFFDLLLMYALLYEKAFKVAELFEKAKAILILQSRRSVAGDDWEILRRHVKSVPTLGIKVGQFHMMERTSTPVFLHYVLSNVVNMLVVFR